MESAPMAAIVRKELARAGDQVPVTTEDPATKEAAAPISA
jgi:hypothetical protein